MIQFTLTRWIWGRIYTLPRDVAFNLLIFRDHYRDSITEYPNDGSMSLSKGLKKSHFVLNFLRKPWFFWIRRGISWRDFSVFFLFSFSIRNVELWLHGHGPSQSPTRQVPFSITTNFFVTFFWKFYSILLYRGWTNYHPTNAHIWSARSYSKRTLHCSTY